MVVVFSGDVAMLKWTVLRTSKWGQYLSAKLRQYRNYILTKPSPAIYIYCYHCWYLLQHTSAAVDHIQKIQNTKIGYTATKASSLFLEPTVAVYPSVQDDHCIGLVTIPPSCVNCLEILGGSNSWSSKSLSRAVICNFMHVRVSVGNHLQLSEVLGFEETETLKVVFSVY